MMALRAPLSASSSSSSSYSSPPCSNTITNTGGTVGSRSSGRIRPRLMTLMSSDQNQTKKSSNTISTSSSRGYERTQQTTFTRPVSSPLHTAEEIASRFHRDLTISTLERLFSSTSSPIPPSPSDPPTSPKRRPPVRVAYQGVRGSYCQEAATLAFASSPLSFSAFPSGSGLDSAFSALELGFADRAVLPVENSLDGPIPRNLDLLLRHAGSVQIVGEIVLPVNHCLLTLPGATPSQIRRVVSHPQALSHCHENLKTMDLDAIEEVHNAADFAKYVAENHISDTAVIGSSIASMEFGLEIVHENFQDRPGNYNRFLQLGLQSSAGGAATTGAQKTTVAFSLEKGPSDLFQAMWAFECRGVKVSRVEHRPNRDNPIRFVRKEGGQTGYFDYVFIVDLEGSATDSAVRSGINRLKEVTGFTQVLGSYATC